MKYVHVITVGVSLASNYFGKPEGEVERELKAMDEGRLKKCTKDLCKFLRQGAHEASAEINAMTKFLEAGEVSLAYLLHTDTPIGRCCAKALHAFLNEKDVECRLVEIEGYAGGPKTFRRGLANLVTVLSRILVSHKKVRLCATGGYKPESAIVSILGFIHRVPVYYIHATFNQVIHLPSLPIEWKCKVRKHTEAIEELMARESISRKEFMEKFGQEAAKDLSNAWLLNERDGFFYLDEVGKALLEVVRL